MSVNEQKNNQSFFKLIAAIIGSVYPLPPDYDIPTESDQFVYKSIFDFSEAQVNNKFCLASAKKGKCTKIKQELKNAIQISYYTASIQPNELKSINTEFLRVDENIEVCNQATPITLAKEIKDGLASITATDNLSMIPYCIIYGTIKVAKDSGPSKLIHISAMIVYNGHIYPFGFTNTEVLKNYKAVPMIPVDAVIVSPEIPVPEYSYMVIDVQVLTTDIIGRIERYFNGTLVAELQHAQQYSFTEGNTYSIVFGENYLYLDHPKYFRYRNTVIESCIEGENCASFLEDIFGIKCNYYYFFSNPTSCRRDGSSISMSDLTAIESAIRGNSFAEFSMAISQQHQPSLTLLPNTVTRKTKVVRTRRTAAKFERSLTKTRKRR
jgi:hypothetical protein